MYMLLFLSSPKEIVMMRIEMVVSLALSRSF